MDGKFDIREDEEQQVKLQEIIQLLVAAGYFRARIKGLSPFDKVVGGMTWCIETCNIDVDVDLLFNETLSIGQKISLTEKIVEVLPFMKCPHRIEPHQVQGLDCIHIYPVIQWLVKKALESRAEREQYIRAYCLTQYNKHQPRDTTTPHNILTTAAKDLYVPRRQYRRKEALIGVDEGVQVTSTLLEYGHGGHLLQQDSKSSDKGAGDDTKEETKQLTTLMNQMSSTGVADNSRVGVGAVGSLVAGLQVDKIVAAAELQAQHDNMQLYMESGMGEQQLVISMRQKVVIVEDDLATLQAELVRRRAEEERVRERLHATTEAYTQHTQQIHQLSAGAPHNMQNLEKLRSLICLNEKLKREEKQFKERCRGELKENQDKINELEARVGGEEVSAELSAQYTADEDKVRRMRLALGKKTRCCAALIRKLDDIPTRAELAQYQKRFLELYQQVGWKHKETLQYFTMYNTFCDTKFYLGKELSLINSVVENFNQAMSSTAGREEFITQFEGIIQMVKQNINKIDKRKLEEKTKRNKLNETYLTLMDVQRLYVKTVKDLKEEIHKNELISNKLQAINK